MVLVDTSVWSAALRHRTGVSHERARQVLADIPAEDVSIPGVALQELLSGIRHAEQFTRLRRALRAVPALVASKGDHIAAAELCNRCGQAGLLASPQDFLIATQAARRRAKLVTFDGDFTLMIPHCPGLVVVP